MNQRGGERKRVRKRGKEEEIRAFANTVSKK